MAQTTVKDIGEQGLLARLQGFCPSDVIGDDGAVLDVAEGHKLVVTTDVLVDGVHFSEQTTRPEDVGWRAVAANLSDLAAMGATPLGITIGLSLPSDTPVEWVERLYEGSDRCLKNYQTPILGGDICRSSVITVSITALGQVKPDRIISRFTAQPDDAIVVTGVHGASRAGLELLLHPELGENLSQPERDRLISAHQRPRPRLDVLPHLWAIGDSLTEKGEQRRKEWIAGMDSSDGLADALIQICRCSQVGAEIDQSALLIPRGLTEWLGSEQALNWVLYGGEDFELVLCLPVDSAQALIRRLGENAAIIGKIKAEKSVIIRNIQQSSSFQELSLNQGFQHFAP
ncbi:MAG: thiamine-phosphate kinase [Snowella sp.]|nr:thiamine-phosphate kinase [Snowella sp.]